MHSIKFIEYDVNRCSTDNILILLNRAMPIILKSDFAKLAILQFVITNLARASILPDVNTLTQNIPKLVDILHIRLNAHLECMSVSTYTK